ncbi:baseplate multidomain protein megatron [Alsobacter sp. SYSU BS001988]
MTTLILQAAGSAIGTALGGPIGGAIGQALGAAAGSAIDGALLGGSGQKRVEGPRLKTLAGLGSTEGAPIPRVYGRARIGGEAIWATRFEEVASTVKSGGGKGIGGTGGSASTQTYSYYANLAVGLCEGPIAFVRRIWADGRELDQTNLSIRVHLGSEDQEPDPLIVAKEGADQAPAYRGLAYVVFERLPLAPFGERVPQLSFEVVRPVAGLGARIRAVDLIPGAGEFVYATDLVTREADFGVTTPENRHVLTHASDWAASLDALQALCPRLESVGLVAAWFGDDLRAGLCTIAPRVEGIGRAHAGVEWAAAGLKRQDARLVSQVDGRPAYGGTPSDASVVAAIRDLKARGLKVMLYPFVMMDVPAGNALPNPATGAPGQPPYPWRGRITCHPAPGVAGSPDATPAAGAQIAALFGSARREDFAVVDEGVAYAGPDEWSLRRHVLHYAHLAAAAGGVDTMLIGSELVGVTRTRSAPGAYPAAALLVALAADVKAVVGPATKVVYAADWTEYGAHVPAPGELRFPLDPLWASPAIDAVGVDLWQPMGDWRDAPGHRDAALGRNAADPAYLSANVARGEGYDWYYADDVGRAAQARLPITDGAYGKPWVFRPKDFVNWWARPHVERTGGVEAGAPTAWIPQSKPILFVECGCPAVDKGANGPNAFPDPKSIEGRPPPFSRNFRDDLIQARAVAALLAHFDPASPGFDPADNPVSHLYGGRMVDPARIHVWAWDARPFPAFPALSGVWSDASSWERGHWLTGRLEGAALDELVAAILEDWGAAAPGRMAIDGFLDGYVVDRPLSARAALEPLAALFEFDAAATGGMLSFSGRHAQPVATLTEDDLVPDRDGATLRLTRAQDSDLPGELTLGFIDAEGDYARASVMSRRLEGASRRESQTEIAAALPRAAAARLADMALYDAWVGRETVQFGLRPGWLALEVGDCVRLPVDGAARPFRITRIRDAEQRDVTARAVETGTYDAPPRAGPVQPIPAPSIAGRPFAVVVDLPLARQEPAVLQALAVAAEPWPGRLAVWRSSDGAAFEAEAFIDRPCALGRLIAPLAAGPLWRWDDAAELRLTLGSGALPAPSDAAALAQATLVGVQGADGAWEALCFARSELIGPGQWRLSRLIRGLGGSEAAAARPAPAGSLVALLDSALTPLGVGAASLGRGYSYRVGPAPRGSDDAAVTAFSASPGPAALACLSPVRAQATRTPGGVGLRWIRRGRSEADAWEPVEIPLGEEAEAYAVDILSGGQVVRTLDCAAPRALYAAAEELADFGAAQTRLAVRIAQVSAAVGRGAALAADLPIL